MYAYVKFTLLINLTIFSCYLDLNAKNTSGKCLELENTIIAFSKVTDVKI